MYNLGIFNRAGIVSFKSGLEGMSSIDNDGQIHIETVRLDDILRGKQISFIKMDIEGSELEALQGAEEIIRNQKPKLAICVYHKKEDIISIPSLLLKYNSNYKFKLRHYSTSPSETVLYAF